MTTDSITSPSKGLRVQHAGPVLTVVVQTVT